MKFFIKKLFKKNLVINLIIIDLLKFDKVIMIKKSIF